MKYLPELESARLIKRYKRFLADIENDRLGRVTIHCPNTGSMKNCAEPGWKVWYSTSTNKKRKYAQTWELVETDTGDFIGINASKANDLTREAINSGVIRELQGYASLASEVKYGQENSRIDILLSNPGVADCYIEVKSVTLVEQGTVGFFPDAISERGRKHLRELVKVKQDGMRAVLLYCVQHTAAEIVKPALHIDPEYAATLIDAIEAGVEVIAYRSSMSPAENKITGPVPFSIGAPSE